jgi:hypothetical protein
MGARCVSVCAWSPGQLTGSLTYPVSKILRSISTSNNDPLFSIVTDVDVQTECNDIPLSE